MSRNGLRALIRRWLGGRRARPVLGAGLVFATLAWGSIALAQEHAAAPHAAASAAEAAGHEGEGHEGAAHEGHEGGGHHDPAPFNFADVDRYNREKDAASKGEKDAHGNPVTPVTPYAYLVVNTLILFAAYYYLGKKPVASSLEARRATIAKELEEAARVKKEAEARLAEYSGRLEKLDAELDRIKAELVEAGKKDRARIIAEAEEKAERMRKDAQFLLEQEMKQMRIDLTQKTVDAAIAAATKVLEQRVTAQDQERLGDDYVKQVAASPKAGGAS